MGRFGSLFPYKKFRMFKKYTKEDIKEIQKWLLTKQNRDEISSILDRPFDSIHYKIRSLGFSKLLNKQKKQKKEPKQKSRIRMPAVGDPEYEEKMREIYLEMFGIDIMNR